MQLRHRKQRKNISIVSGTIIGVVIAVLITVVSAAIAALLIANEQLPIESMRYAAVLIWTVSSLAGGAVAQKAVAEKKLIACIIACGAYLLLLFSIAITLFDSLGRTVWIGAVCTIIGCGAAVLAELKPKKGTRRLRKMRISR